MKPKINQLINKSVIQLKRGSPTILTCLGVAGLVATTVSAVIATPKAIEKIKKDSLLNNGTWAYLGSASNKSKRYLFWTSVHTDTVGANRTIPVIISTADNKFYVSETTTAVRNNNSSKYVTIAEHLTYTNHQQLINAGTKYDTLKDAYDAYAKLVTEGKYQDYKDTLPKS